jgi:hypothetical protein
VPRTVSWRFVLLFILIGAIQASLAAGLFGYASAIADSGQPVPGPLSIAVSVLGTPGMFLSDALKQRLGDPTSIYVGFGIGGVLWGCVLGLITLYIRRRRSR